MEKPPPLPANLGESSDDSDYVIAPKKSGTGPVTAILVALIGAVGGGGGLYVTMVGPAQDQVKQATTERDQLKTKLEAAEKEVAAAKTSADDELRRAREESQQLRDDLTKSNADKDADRALLDKLKSEVGGGGEVKGDAGSITVTMVDKILFGSGDATLTPEGEVVLRRLASVLKGLDKKVIEVGGHADNARIESAAKEKFPTNWELSAARATNVVRFLAEQGGVPPRKLKAAGYGSTRPVASNKSAAGRAKNRRIEILLLPDRLNVVKGDFADEVAAAETRSAPTADKAKVSGKKPATQKLAVAHVKKKR